MKRTVIIASIVVALAAATYVYAQSQSKPAPADTRIDAGDGLVLVGRTSGQISAILASPA